MLKLINITKNYIAGDTVVPALKGIDIEFRKSEFVSVLGPSGCGKTTLLNIIGGLDIYTDGDLMINNKSTKEFKDSDWDTYRNHSIGFVFQSYNLIPHQTVLSNVELALTLSGVSNAERKRKAIEALTKVGLADQLKKKPNQLSGGQMQRVAIARSLVNDPDILLADEPTGALDTETSVQIMEILKEISKEKLVIMVTHNPELADKYSTRIVRLIDGLLTSDTDPYNEETAAGTDKANIKPEKKAAKPSMSFFTALMLSLNNLMTKKTRTLLTAFAGSIGIIGIALILSLSNGIQNFIDGIQEDTLSSYPITIESKTVDMTSLISSLAGNKDGSAEHEKDKVYSNTVMYNLMNNMMSSGTRTNNLKAFKKFLEDDKYGLDRYVSAIQYGYDITFNIYGSDTSEGVKQINPSTVFDKMYGSSDYSSYVSYMSSFSGFEIWQEILPGKNGGLINDLVKEQYDVIYGEWPDSYDEVVLIVDKNNELSDMVLYSLGLKDPAEISDIMKAVMSGKPIDAEAESWTYEELCNMTFSLVFSTDFYQKDSKTGTWKDMRDNETYMKYLVDNGLRLKITGIIRPNEDAVATAMTGSVGYTSALTEHYIERINSSEAIAQQNNDKTVDIFTGLPFPDGTETELTDAEKASAITGYFSSLGNAEKAAIYAEIASVPTNEELAAMLSQYMQAYPDRTSMEALISQIYTEKAGMDEETVKSYIAAMSDDEIAEAVEKILTEAVKSSYAENISSALSSLSADQIAAMFDQRINLCTESELAALYDTYMPDTVSDSTYEKNMTSLGAVDLSDPSKINIYSSTFEAKDAIADIIKEYNKSVENEADEINYTDYIALLMSSISKVFKAISYVLIAFVAVSLVVSSIMIGIITYISVLERTKEIGILRAIGASKKDISRVFNAETVIVGFTAGAIGIGITLLLILPTNAIIQHSSGLNNISAQLPITGGIVLVLISMFLTFISGLIPSRLAAKKDPVVALRTE